MIRNKDISKKQMKLLRRWVTAARFSTNVLTHDDKKIIKECISTGKYSLITDKDRLMSIRETWIEFLIEEQKWVFLTRNEKNIITNDILNSKNDFRSTLDKSDLDFLVQTINNGYYSKKKQSTFTRIYDKWKDYLPF